MLQQDQYNQTQRHQQVNHDYNCFQHLSVSCGATNRTKLIRIEGGTTNQPPIDVRHAEQFDRIRRFDATAIQQANTAGDFGIFCRQLRADGRMYFLSLLRRGGQARPDCPHWLVSHNGAGESPDTQILYHSPQLTPDDFQGLSSFALLAGLTHAQHRNQTAGLRCGKLTTDDTVAFTQNLAAFRVPNQNQRATGIAQLTCSNLARQGALHRLDCAILRTHSQGFAVQALNHLIDVQTGRQNRHVDTCRQSQLSQAFDQLRNTGAGTVHFPVPGH